MLELEIDTGGLCRELLEFIKAAYDISRAFLIVGRKKYA